jgi:hypothetical protein
MGSWHWGLSYLDELKTVNVNNLSDSNTLKTT